MNNLISVIIPVKNGAATLNRCLEGLYNQTVADNIEVIIIDSGSSDDSHKIFMNYPVRFYAIDPQSFNHGETRNYGVSLAKGELVVMTVQDAFPEDNQWLAKMIYHFKNHRVAAVCGNQIVPHDKDKNPHEWYRPQSNPNYRNYHFESPAEFLALDPVDKRKVCSWDNVNAMYRKSILEKIPFPRTMFAEDMSWAKQALLAGYTLVYENRATVIHYHHTDFQYQFRRVITVLYHQYKLFDFIPEWRFSLRPYLLIFYRNLKYRAKLYWVYYQWRKLAAAHYAYYRFTKELRKGEEILEQYHNIINPEAPQGIQKRIN